MKSLLWLVVLVVALVWPSRLAGPLDGAPLDHPSEVVALALVLLLWLATPAAARDHRLRILSLVLLVWKLGLALIAGQDGLCVRFTSPVPLYRDNVYVPHSWDVRADWQSPTPVCSAVMTRDYPEVEYFPAWFYNLPPADPGRAATPADRPPNVRTGLTLTGYVNAAASGRLRILASGSVPGRVRLLGRDYQLAELAGGVDVPPGIHPLKIDAQLEGAGWQLAMDWNGVSPWAAGRLTLGPPTPIDRWLRPWANYVPALIVGLVSVLLLQSFVMAHAGRLTVVLTMSLLMLLVGWSGREVLMRLSPLLLLLALVRPPRRREWRVGVALLLLPWMAMWLPRAAAQAGAFTWYSSGDDWWMFQRFAYRIFLQGYWLEGGEVTFWFQPLYRWIAGALHMVFGDSSVGELLWDAAAAGIGALFAFRITAAHAGAPWGVMAGVLVLLTFSAGPAWHLFGRGLSEFSSAGLLYAAALLSLRAEGTSAVIAGLLALLATFTRLNNLPMALTVAAFAVPAAVQARHLWRPAAWLTLASRPVAAGIIGVMAAGLWLFTARTYYYTGVPDMLYGTTARLNSVWSGAGGFALVERLVSSVLMLVTMNDPPRFDWRALPVIGGTVASGLGILGVGWFGRLPLNVTLLCLSGIVGGLIARGVAYPGRFSIHLVPAAITVATLALALWMNRSRPDRTVSPDGP